MKFHYINILLFALPLNILVHNQRNLKKTILRTPKNKATKTHRTLCECELYAPSNYENDPEMKELMENFYHHTSERFLEYDERVEDKRKQCKEQCDKDIQKIILKDKIEKELTEKFATLETNIDNNDIPTCVCERSMADKTEKVCLNCGKSMGALAPSWSLLNGIGYAAWTHYVGTAVANAATDAGVKAAIKGLGNVYELIDLPGVNIPGMVNGTNYFSPSILIEAVKRVNITICPNYEDKFFCFSMDTPRMVFSDVTKVASGADEAAKAAASTEAAKYTSTTSIYSTFIIASIVAIAVIVLVMVIIYLILHYRRKKKMKKKLQYIKLLKE
ncbi:PIR protein, putative [Plasmodium sp.]|nr:PIR protein, putative [Plasmodium sp.]